MTYSLVSLKVRLKSMTNHPRHPVMRPPLWTSQRTDALFWRRPVTKNPEAATAQVASHTRTAVRTPVW
jgi:hypothetical protein